MTAKSALPAAPAHTADNSRERGASSSLPAPSFGDMARAILSAPPESDTVQAISAALRVGQTEFMTSHEHVAVLRISTRDPLTTDADAGAARVLMVELGAKIERIESAFNALNERLTDLIQRTKANDKATIEQAARARYVAAADAVLSGFPELAGKLAGLLAELNDAAAGCNRLHIRNAISIEVHTMLAGLGGRGGDFGHNVKLPMLGETNLRHWPVVASFVAPPRSGPSLAEMKANEAARRVGS